jgi:hypothetical protein
MAELTGENPQDVAVDFGIVDPNQGDFFRGATSGVDSMQGGLYALGGYAGDLANVDGVRDWGFKNYQANMDEVNLRSKAYDNIENAESVGDYVDSAQYWLGYSLPQIVEAVVGSKGGAFIGRKTVESHVKKKVVERFGKDKVDSIMSSKVVQNAIDKGGDIGGYGGIGVQAVGTELGHTYGGAVDEAIAQGGTIDDVDLGDVGLYGGLAGVAEFGTDVLTLGLAKFGPAKDMMKGVGKGKSRIRSGLGKGTIGGTAEAFTEMGQTGLEEMGAGKSFEEANFSDPTSAWAGFIGGGAMGLAGGLATRPDAKDAVNIAAEEAQGAAKQKADDDAIIQQQAEAEQNRQAQEIDDLKELRDQHSQTFPDEASWSSEQEAEQNQRDRFNLGNEQTELGSAFKQWRKDNDVHLSNNEKANDKIIKRFLGDYATPVSSEEKRNNHLNALDAHAQLQERKKLRGDDENATISEQISALLQAHNIAVSDGNLEVLNAIEQEAETMIDPAEWAEAKRNNASEQKGLKTPKVKTVPTIETETVDTNTAPIIEPTEEETGEVDPNPYRGTRSTSKEKFWDDAAGMLGPNFESENPELSPFFGSMDYSRATKALEAIVADMGQQKADALVADNTGKELSAADEETQPIVEAEVSLNKGLQAAVIPFVKAQAKEGISYHSEKMGVTQWEGQAIADDLAKTLTKKQVKELGLEDKNIRKRIPEVLTSYGKKIGRVGTPKTETKKQFLAKTKKKQDAAAKDDVPVEVQKDLLSPDETTGVGQRFGSISKVSSTQSNTSAVDKTTKAEVDRKAEESSAVEDEAFNLIIGKNQELIKKGDKLSKKKSSKKERDAFNKEVKDFGSTVLEYTKLHPGIKTKVISRLILVERAVKALSNKEVVKRAGGEWNSGRTKGTSTFAGLPADIKYEWIVSVDEFLANGDNQELLAEDRSAIEAQIAERATQLENKEEKDGKDNSKRKTKGEAETEGTRLELPEPKTDGLGANTNTRKNTEEIRTEKVKAKIVKKAKLMYMRKDRLIAYAKELGVTGITDKLTKQQIVSKITNKTLVKSERAALRKVKTLGPNWMTEHPDILEMFSKGRFDALNEAVDSLTKEGTKTESDSAVSNAQKDQKAQAKGEILRQQNKLEKAVTKPEIAEAINEIHPEQSSSQLQNKSKADLDIQKEEVLQELQDRLKGKRTPIEQKGKVIKYSLASKIKSLFKSVPENRKDGFQNILEKMFGGNVPSKVLAQIHVVDTVAELNEKFPSTGGFNSDSTTGGVYIRSDDATETVVFVLENIEPGNELSVFMHEVGSHLGLENLLSDSELDAMVSKIKSWAKEGDNSRLVPPPHSAQAIAKRALARVSSARISTGRAGGRLTPITVRAETIAYFVEESVLAGVTPTNDSPLGKFVDLIISAFKDALAKLKIFSQEGIDNLTPQDFVDLAFGAAKIGLKGLGTKSRNKILIAENRKLDAESGVRQSTNQNKIDAFIARRFPKDAKGKYIPESRLTKPEYSEFQKSQYRLEQQARMDIDETIAIRLKEAEAHEKAMYVKSSMNIKNEEDYAAKRKELQRIIDDPYSDTESLAKAKTLMLKLKSEKKEMDSDVAVVKFSVKAKENKQDIRTVRDWIRDHFGSTTTQVWDDMVEVFRGGANSTKFLHQFIREVTDKMPSAKKWHEAILLAEKTRNEIKQIVDDIAISAREMSANRLRAVNQFIEKSTREQIWGYNPYDKNDARYKKVVVNPEARELFNNLDTEQQELSKAVFAHGEAMLERKRAIAKAFGVTPQFFGVSGLNGPYAPLKRFGKFVTVFKSSTFVAAEKALKEKPNNINRDYLNGLRDQEVHYEVRFHGSMGSAKKHVDANKHKFEYAEASPKTEVVVEGRSPDHKVLAKVIAGLGASGMDTKSVEYQAVESMIKTMYVESLDEENSRRSQIKRQGQGVAGYDSDMIRAFVSNATAEANLIASMEHGVEINTALMEANTQKNEDVGHLGRIYNMMVSHYVENLNNNPTPVQDRLAAVNTVYMLTSSIGYHLTNATQPIMVTIPKLVGDFGTGNYTTIIRKMIAGYKIARAVVSFEFKNLRFQTKIDITKAPKKYQALLKDLQLRQLLDVGIEQDLAEFNTSESGYELINKGSEKASTFAHRLYQIARMVEAYNRISTATAAYDMAESNPSVTTRLRMDSSEYATNMVEDTQGNFSSMDAPLILKKLPKITGQYRKYQIMMAWVYAEATKKAFTGTSAEEKAAGKRTVGFALGHAALFSGATGVPFLGWVAPLFLGMGNEGDEPEDLERWIRRNVQNETLASVLSRGLPSIIGVDMSTKLSQQKIFHPLPYTDFALDQGAMKEGIFEAILGPSGSTISNFMRSAEYASEGNLYRSLEYALPKGIRGAMESYRLGTEGYSLRNGDVIPYDFSGWSLLLNSLGIPASDVTSIKWTRGQQYELTKWFEDRQSEIRKDYIKAYKNKDSSRRKELREEWVTLQKSKGRIRPFFNNERGTLRSTPLSNLLKSPRKQRKRERKYQKQLGVY